MGGALHCMGLYGIRSVDLYGSCLTWTWQAVSYVVGIRGVGKLPYIEWCCMAMGGCRLCCGY